MDTPFLVPDAPLTPKKYNARIVDMDDVHPHIRIFQARLENDGGMVFQAGQYVWLTFEGCEPRPYSIASTPAEPGQLTFHVLDMGGGGTSQHACTDMKQGEPVIIEGPHGKSYLRGTNTPILLIAGGVGIVPALSIIDTALKTRMTAPIALYWGVKTENDLYLDQHFRALARRHENFRYIPVFSDLTESGGPFRVGLVGEEAAKDFDDLSGYHAYLAGPKIMVMETAPLLQDKGIKRENIFSDTLS